MDEGLGSAKKKSVLGKKRSLSAESSPAKTRAIDPLAMVAGLGALPQRAPTPVHSIESLADWNHLARTMYRARHDGPLRRVSVPWNVRMAPPSADEKRTKGTVRRGSRSWLMQNRSEEQKAAGDAAVNYLLGTGKQAYRYATDRPDKPPASGLDDVADPGAYAKNVLRVMKGKAGSRDGLVPSSKGDRQKSLFAGALIMTSERLRSQKSPVLAYAEHYKVHHTSRLDGADAGGKALRAAYHPLTGSFVPARVGERWTERNNPAGASGPEQIRKLPPAALVGAFKDRAMRDIYDRYASKKKRHAGGDFETWANYKLAKAVDRWGPVGGE